MPDQGVTYYGGKDPDKKVCTCRHTLRMHFGAVSGNPRFCTATFEEDIDENGYARECECEQYEERKPA